LALTNCGADPLELEDLMIVEFMDSSYEPNPEALAALADALKLSRCEREDLVGIAGGVTAEHIASARNVAISTVRQRIKSLLSKAACARQQDLICLVRSLCPADRAPSERKCLLVRSTRTGEKAEAMALN
jgi:DNA-binding CsgD family transcriptional regulator